MTYTVVATTWDGVKFDVDFESLDKAMKFFDKRIATREAIARYEDICIFDEHERVFRKWYSMSEEDARDFYFACHEKWHDGIISESGIADEFLWSVDKVRHLLEACLAWGLPVDKANGMWAF